LGYSPDEDSPQFAVIVFFILVIGVADDLYNPFRENVLMSVLK